MTEAFRRARLFILLAVLSVTTVAPTATQGQDPRGDATAADEPPADSPQKLDINRATAAEMVRVPQLGKSTVERIIRGRPYQSVDELAKVGVSAKTIESLRPIVVVGPPSAPGPRVTRRPPTQRREGDEAGKVDLNSADAMTLQTLPGIGPTLARAIVDGRPYESFEDLGRVRGLTPAKFAAFRDRVTLESTALPIGAATQPVAGVARSDAAAPRSTPATGGVDLNTASQEQLETLPLIGPAKARSIIEHRPYRSIEEVMKVPGIKQGTFERIKPWIRVGG